LLKLFSDYINWINQKLVITPLTILIYPFSKWKLRVGRIFRQHLAWILELKELSRDKMRK